MLNQNYKFIRPHLKLFLFVVFARMGMGTFSSCHSHGSNVPYLIEATASGISLFMVFGITNSMFYGLFALLSYVINCRDKKYQEQLITLFHGKSAMMVLFSLPIFLVASIHRLLILDEKKENVTEYVLRVARFLGVLALFVLASQHFFFLALLVFYLNFLFSALVFILSYFYIAPWRQFLIRYYFNSDSATATRFMVFFFGS